MSSQAICIIDDNDTFRQSMGWLLSGMGHSVTEFSDPRVGLNAITDGLNCECLLIDVRMPEMSGLDVHDKLIEAGAQIPVVYMTGHGDIALAVEAMNKGAITFLEKPLDTTALKKALDKVADVQRKRVKGSISINKMNQFQEDLKKLTPREAEVMHAIVEGKANKVTAYDLGISQKTVELHRSRVMRKLPVRSSQELVKMVILSQ